MATGCGTTNPNSKIDLCIPFWILLVPDDLCPSLVSSKGYDAVGIHQLFLDGANMEELLHPLKVPRVHLREILSSEHSDGECARNQTHSRRTQQVTTREGRLYRALAGCTGWGLVCTGWGLVCTGWGLVCTGWGLVCTG